MSSNLLPNTLTCLIRPLARGSHFNYCDEIFNILLLSLNHTLIFFMVFEYFSNNYFMNRLLNKLFGSNFIYISTDKINTYAQSVYNNNLMFID